ncbi:hypothetical protein CLV71_12150 [Actinophytocola oryzae]|uniref:CBS domain-containing protein n=1 Tax=Actinophytocola oryzae TaxID=502181 RepID=A0A4R7UXV3_9PSEU|nr:hypothetical protein CLV71_12150 [Actinophytocola oryzae]
MGDDVDPREALAKLEQAEHVVVTTADGSTLGVLDEAELTAFDARDTALAALAQRFPPLLVLADHPDELSGDELVDLAELVGRIDAHHVLLVNEGRPAGVVSRATIATALPLDLLAADVRSGDPDVPALGYVCTRCTPPYHLRLSTPTPDGRPPTCGRIAFHGEMEPDA